MEMPVKKNQANTYFRTSLLTIVFILLLLCSFVLYLLYVNQKLENIERNRLSSVNVALEILNHSSTLTEMAHYYTATGDSKYKNYYEDVIGIRNGTLSKPTYYSSFYWAYVLGGKRNHVASLVNNGKASATKELKLSELELDLLKRAEQRANKLNSMEHRAFILLSGSTEKNKKEAEQILFGSDYLKARANFLETIEELTFAIDLRTKNNIMYIKRVEKLTSSLFIILAIAAIIFFMIIFCLLKRRVLGPINEQVDAYIASTLDSLKNKEQQNLLLNKMNELLHSCYSVEEAYSIIQVTAKDLFQNLNGGFAAYNTSSDELKTVCQWGQTKYLPEKFSRLSCWAMRSSSIYIIRNEKNDVICQHFTEIPQGWYLDFPLIVREEVIGLLHVNGHPFFPLETGLQQLIITFGENIKLALANINLREALRYQAIRDGLTGLFNRRYLDETLPRELKYINRDKGVLTVAMLDIDNFKKVNDEYGHDVGDVVLKSISTVFQQAFRAGDISCRFGGEEFVIVLLGSGKEEAKSRIENICEKIKQLVIQTQGIHLPPITLSAGIASAPEHGSKAEEILGKADEALYAAKKAGKDRVFIYKPRILNNSILKDPG